MNRFLSLKSVRFSLIVLALYTIAAVWGEIQYRRAQFSGETPAYNVVREERRYEAPSLKEDGYIMGSDNLGRSVAMRLCQGTRIAFHVGVVTSLIAIPLGVLLGAVGGYYGGRVDSFVVWLSATVSAVTSLILILAISMVVGKGLMGIYLGIGFTTWVGVCRNVRAEVIKHRNRTYVQAAQMLGFSSLRILFRHIIPNVFHVILVSFSIRFPAAIGTEVFVSCLGIGVQGEPSWGSMLNNSRMRLWQGVWWEMTFVTLAIFGLVLAFNILADRLRDMTTGEDNS